MAQQFTSSDAEMQKKNSWIDFWIRRSKLEPEFETERQDDSENSMKHKCFPKRNA